MFVFIPGLGIVTLAIGLVARSLVSITVTTGTGFNWKERVFVTLTWLAKATVQVGGVVSKVVCGLNNHSLCKSDHAESLH